MLCGDVRAWKKGLSTAAQRVGAGAVWPGGKTNAVGLSLHFPCVVAMTKKRGNERKPGLRL